MRALLPAALVIAALGCGGSTAQDVPAHSDGLTVEAWRELPVELKYDEATFDRLRENDSRLRTERGWDEFMRTVVVPERKRDIPTVPGEPIP